MFLPVQQHVHFDPIIGLVRYSRVNESVHSGLVLEAQPEKNGRLKSGTCSFTFFEKDCAIALKALLFSCLLELAMLLMAVATLVVSKTCS